MTALILVLLWLKFEGDLSALVFQRLLPESKKNYLPLGVSHLPCVQRRTRVQSDVVSVLHDNLCCQSSWWSSLVNHVLFKLYSEPIWGINGGKVRTSKYPGTLFALNFTVFWCHSTPEIDIQSFLACRRTGSEIVLRHLDHHRHLHMILHVFLSIADWLLKVGWGRFW